MPWLKRPLTPSDVAAMLVVLKGPDGKMTAKSAKTAAPKAVKKVEHFDPFDEHTIDDIDVGASVTKSVDPPTLEGVPESGTIFSSRKARGVNSHVKKDLKSGRKCVRSAIKLFCTRGSVC